MSLRATCVNTPKKNSRRNQLEGNGSRSQAQKMMRIVKQAVCEVEIVGPFCQNATVSQCIGLSDIFRFECSICLWRRTCLLLVLHADNVQNRRGRGQVFLSPYVIAYIHLPAPRILQRSIQLFPNLLFRWSRKTSRRQRRNNKGRTVIELSRDSPQSWASSAPCRCNPAQRR